MRDKGSLDLDNRSRDEVTRFDKVYLKGRIKRILRVILKIILKMIPSILYEHPDKWWYQFPGKYILPDKS